MAGSPQMEEYMRNFNMNPEEVNKQLEDLGVSQEEIVSKMLGDPELREVSSSPPGHVCACNGIHEEPGVTQEETGSNKASCGHEGIAAMAFLCMQLRLRGSGVTQEETVSGLLAASVEYTTARACLCLALHLRGVQQQTATTMLRELEVQVMDDMCIGFTQEPALDCEWQSLTSAGDPRAP